MYVSNGDNNGICYHLGTAYGKQQLGEPCGCGPHVGVHPHHSKSSLQYINVTWRGIKVFQMARA